MAKTRIWDRIQHFTPHENWGSPSKISHALLLLLDQTRQFLGTPIFISRAYDLQAAKNSTHRTGHGADILLPECTRHPIDILIAIERFNWGGIGYYPHWEYMGKQIGGWHLDVRERAKHHPSARWMGVDDADGSQKYVGLTYANLKKYGVIE